MHACIKKSATGQGRGGTHINVRCAEGVEIVEDVPRHLLDQLQRKALEVGQLQDVVEGHGQELKNLHVCVYTHTRKCICIHTYRS